MPMLKKIASQMLWQGEAMLTACINLISVIAPTALTQPTSWNNQQCLCSLAMPFIQS